MSSDIQDRNGGHRLDNQIEKQSITPESHNIPDKNESLKGPQPPTFRKGLRFFAIIVALSFAGLLTALEATITSTALPTIIQDLKGANLYVWVINIYFLTMAAFQPLYGQLANVFGRRYPIIFSTAAFIFGSGICGGASNIQMLVAGRAVQGIGAGGISVLIDIILCDLIPLRERGNYLALMFGLIALGTALGPLFGGLIVQYSSWRWVFYLNLPVGGVTLLLLIVFLHVNYEKETKISIKLKRIDWIGTIIFVLSMISTLIALSWAGAKYPWSSICTLVPLILGLLGLVAYLFYQGSRWCVEPTMPVRLFANRTSTMAFILTFIHGVVVIWTVYFLPVYFQGVLASTPGHSGLQLLPTVLFMIPSAAVSGSLLAKFGRYRPVHHVGFAIIIIGFGLFSLLDASSSTAEWVIYQAIEAVGAGLVLPALLPAVQAGLTEADTALSTSTWSFIRSFGMIWGATIPANIFNNRFDLASNRIQDPAIVAQLTGGKAYEHATREFLNSITNNSIRLQVVNVFSDSLKTMWYVSIAFAGLGFLLVIVEREVALRKELNTEFGMVEQKGKDALFSAETGQPSAVSN